jgi:hypothetical protein
MVKLSFRGVATLAALAVGATSVMGYVPSDYRWPDGNIVMHLQLGRSGALIDGSADWNQSFEAALSTWNTFVAPVKFTVVRDSAASIASLNGANNVFFSSTNFGRAFGENTLAVTTTWYVGATAIESDVVFNNKWSWNSYPGPLRPASGGEWLHDLRRVALHESGHVLGLGHPDAAGQAVVAQMNSHESNLDTLADDDIAGARARYPFAAATLPLPPGPPSGLTAFSSGSSVTLAWRAPSGGGAPSAYTIEAGSTSGSANLASFSTGNAATGYTAEGVGAGPYFVRVKATNAAGTSAPSNEALLTVGGGCTAPPGAPGNLRVSSNSGGTIVFAWNAASGSPTTYLIEAGSAPGTANLANSDLGGSATAYTATGVGRGTYFVRLRPKNACGTGSPSNEVTVSVQ